MYLQTCKLNKKAFNIFFQNPLLNTEDKHRQLTSIMMYWVLHQETHRLYAMMFHFCQILNFVNVIAQASCNVFSG